MTRLFPFPVLSAALALAWLALTELSPLHLAGASVLALIVPLAAAPLIRGLPRIRAPRTALRLVGRVIWDIVVANVNVARLVLGPVARLRPAFVEVPVTLTHPHAIALLASIVTMTPGTVSVALEPDSRVLVVHALDVEDPALLVAIIKERYERSLLEIFEC